MDGFGSDSFAQGSQAGFVVGFVQDQAFERDDAELVERGVQLERLVRRSSGCRADGGSGVAPTATEDEVHQEKSSEEEDSQDREEPHHPDY